MENKADEKDYEKLYNERHKKPEEEKVVTREDLKKQNPKLTDAQIDEMLSRLSEEAMCNIFEGDADDSSKKDAAKATMFSVKELKGEKAYKTLGKEIGEYIAKEGQSHNHIPRLFGALFHELSEKVSVIKMRQIVKDFDERLKIKEKEEKDKADAEKKLDKKKPKNKKAKVGGVSKALDSNVLLLDNAFADEYDGEGEYEGEGDSYVDYGRDEIDFM